MIQLWQNDDLGVKEFAFLDTVTDTFVNLSGFEVFSSVEAFVQSYEHEQMERHYGDVERFTSKLRAAGWEIPDGPR